MPRHVKWVSMVLLTSVGAALSGAAPLEAQARLSGVVVDSVAGKPLASAFVQNCAGIRSKRESFGARR
jgi:hypothetical protein